MNNITRKTEYEAKLLSNREFKTDSALIITNISSDCKDRSKAMHVAVRSAGNNVKDKSSLRFVRRETVLVCVLREKELFIEKHT